MITEGELKSIAKEIKRSQDEWLEKTIMRLLPGKHQEMIKRRQVTASQMLRWARENGLQVTFLSATMSIEVRAKGQLVDRYTAKIRVPCKERDNELRPVDIFKLKHPEVYGDDYWEEGS